MGTRLRPYTDFKPKPMVDINGISIIHRSIEKLKAEGVRQIVINIHYLRDVLKEHLKAVKGVDIILSIEDKLLDTGGGIKNAIHHFGDDPFYCINGDALWDDESNQTALSRLCHFWDKDKMDMALLLEPQDLMIGGFIGDYDLNIDGTIKRHLNKGGTHMYAGIQILHPRVFKDMPDGAFSLLGLMDKAQEEKRLYGLAHNAPWYHISTPKDYEDVNALFKRRGE